MDKMYVGSYWCGAEETPYYTNDWKEIYHSNGEIVSDEELHEQTVWLNSPWSKSCITYDIRRVLDDEREKTNSPEWKCECEVIGYDFITTSLVGYGDTPSGALESTAELFAWLQETYNKENVKL